MRYDDDDDDAFDANGLLKDGRSTRVTMRDSLTPLQQAIAEARASRINVVDAQGATAGLHRPGSRYINDADAYAPTAAARRQAITDTADAWRKPPGGAAIDDEGNPCTVNGAPGTLVRQRDGGLACVATKQKDSTTDARATAWAAMVDAQSQAWSKPHG
jgi:hypothetical protein